MQIDFGDEDLHLMNLQKVRFSTQCCGAVSSVVQVVKHLRLLNKEYPKDFLYSDWFTIT